MERQAELLPNTTNIQPAPENQSSTSHICTPPRNDGRAMSSPGLRFVQDRSFLSDLPHGCPDSNGTTVKMSFESFTNPSSGQERKFNEMTLSTDESTSTTPSQQADFICNECSKINFQEIFDLELATLQESIVDGLFISHLGTRFFQYTGKHCALCQIFSSACISSGSAEAQGYDLRAYCFLRYSGYTSSCFDHPKEIQDQWFLAVVPAGIQVGLNFLLQVKTPGVGLIFCYNTEKSSTDIFIPRRVPARLDYSTVMQWLAYCRVNHTQSCGSRRSQSLGLKLIDCVSLSVIDAPQSACYAALSYVWGRNGEVKCIEGAQLLWESLPRVISDAITATKELGLQFLWVDKICIDQNDPETKHEQISQMDDIYRSAEFTIVAAAGNDQSTGLPGVGEKLRRTQPTARIGNLQIISSMAHPHHSIRSSIWWTRGWTYQEAVLSQRLLVFTENQVYFECNAMNCFESIQNNLDLTHTELKDKSLRFMRSGLFSDQASQSAPYGAGEPEKHKAWEIYLNHIHRYSGKTLSFEDDSLQAFLGVARHF
ncbi:Heterokaryon incompatibility protein (HET) domain containing protein [Hyaloscypha variabilis]